LLPAIREPGPNPDRMDLPVQLRKSLKNQYSSPLQIGYIVTENFAAKIRISISIQLQDK
jgi:hypothetical protein